MKIAILGCGVMGGAFGRHFSKQHDVLCFDRNRASAESLAQQCQGKVADTIKEAVSSAEVVLLGIKPKDLTSIASALSQGQTQGKLVISMLAGVSLATLQKHFPQADLLRVMPNLALTCNQGVVGMVESEQLSEQRKTCVEELLEGMGLNVWMPESKLEALTALSASGIGMLFLMIEAMIEGGICLGFTSQESKDFVLKTMEGAIALIRQSGKHPAELKWNICSPAGTTIAGIQAMEERGVRAGILHGLLAAYERGKAIQKESAL